MPLPASSTSSHAAITRVRNSAPTTASPTGTTVNGGRIHLLFGQSSDKGNILFGVQYDKQEPVSAANRKVSANAQYLYNSGVNSKAGSSRTPGGRYFLPGNSPDHSAARLPIKGGASVTLSGNKLPSLDLAAHRERFPLLQPRLPTVSTSRRSATTTCCRTNAPAPSCSATTS